MSFNPNQIYEQWQQPVDPNQQQQHWQVSHNPQATPSIPAAGGGGGGNYQQSQQSYSWTDGNIQGQHHRTQQSWSWQGQTQGQSVVHQSPPLAFPPLLQNHDSHHLLHHQMHQNVTNHFQQEQAHHQRVADMHRNMSAFAIGGVTPMLLQAQQQQSRIAYHQVVSSPPPMQVQPVSQQNYFSQQQQAQIEYQPMSPVSPVQQVQYQEQPVPQQSCFPQQQAQVAYQPMSPAPPVQQVQHQDNVRQEYLPSSPPQQQQQIQDVPQASSPTILQPQGRDRQQLYQQQPTIQQAPASPLPFQVQNSTPQIFQSPPQAPSRRQLQSQPNEHSPQSALPIESIRPQNHRLMNLEKQRKVDVENTNRAGAEINKRLRDLEQSKTKAQQDHEAKDREVRRLQEQLASVERQRRQDAERNSQQLADLVRSSQATTPASPTGAFDMSALQKVVRETQAHQLTAQDIERVIEEQVSKRLAGMATKQDIQNAGVQMQGALSKVPVGLSQQEVQQAVNRELNKVMQDVANRVNQQRHIAGAQGQSNLQPWQASQDRVQTEFVIEELPDDAVPTHSHRARNHHGGRPQKQLPPAETSGYVLAVDLLMTQQRTLSSVPKTRTLEAPPSSMGHSTAVSQRPTAPPPIRAQITAPYATPGAAHPVVVDDALVASKKPNPVVNIAPQRSQYPALEAPPSAPVVKETSLTRVEKSVPRVNMPLSHASPPQNPQRIVIAPAAQRQLAAPPAAPRRESLQPPSRRLQQIEPAAARQRQLEAPPAQSEGSSGIGQELVVQGREVARKTSGR